MSFWLSSMAYLEVNSVTKAYNNVATIENINLTLEKGEFVSLVGPSGVGKTTLFNILSGLSTPDSGYIKLQDEDITGKSGIFSYMQQKDLLLPFYTVLDNVSMPLRLKGMDKKSSQDKAMEYMEEFGLNGSESKYPSQISGGMKQRAALLRAYLYSDKLLLLDEPFSALDFFTKTAMHQWYKEVTKIHGTTTFLITHDIEEALTLSDKIYIMTGPPGTVDAPLVIHRKDMDTDSFQTSEEFMTYKKMIFEKIKQK